MKKEYLEKLKEGIIYYKNILDIPKDVTFGLEIEYENILKDYVDYYIYELKTNQEIGDWKSKVEFDISEYDNQGNVINGEIVSPILTNNKQTWEELLKITQFLKKYNGYVTNRCGSHINVGAHILGSNSMYWRNFLLLWILYEKEIYNFCSGEFSNVRKRENSISSITLDLDIEKVLEYTPLASNYIYYLTDSLLDKKHDISFKNVFCYNYKKDNVIEFRLPNGTLNEEIIQNYVNFFAHFLLSCKRDLDIDKILYNIKNNIHDEVMLCDFIFNREIDKNDFLIQSLKKNKIYSKEIPSHLHF